jgi:hypothetical protein
MLLRDASDALTRKITRDEFPRDENDVVLTSRFIDECFKVLEVRPKNKLRTWLRDTVRDIAELHLKKEKKRLSLSEYDVGCERQFLQHAFHAELERLVDKCCDHFDNKKKEEE